jgi:hypothetical protein
MVHPNVINLSAPQQRGSLTHKWGLRVHWWVSIARQSRRGRLAAAQALERDRLPLACEYSKPCPWQVSIVAH